MMPQAVGNVDGNKMCTYGLVRTPPLCLPVFFPHGLRIRLTMNKHVAQPCLHVSDLCVGSQDVHSSLELSS